MTEQPVVTRRDEILRYIAAYTIDHHSAPSTIVIGRQFKITHQVVYGHLMKLVKEGRLLQIDGHWKIPEAEYYPPDNLT